MANILNMQIQEQENTFEEKDSNWSWTVCEDNSRYSPAFCGGQLWSQEQISTPEALKSVIFLEPSTVTKARVRFGGSRNANPEAQVTTERR